MKRTDFITNHSSKSKIETVCLSNLNAFLFVWILYKSTDQSRWVYFKLLVSRQLALFPLLRIHLSAHILKRSGYSYVVKCPPNVRSRECYFNFQTISGVLERCKMTYYMITMHSRSTSIFRIRLNQLKQTFSCVFYFLLNVTLVLGSILTLKIASLTRSFSQG